MPRSSDQSYQDFVQIAFAYFVGLVNPANPNAGRSARALYRRYSRYHPDPLIAPKVPLAGDPLYTALSNLINNVGNREIRVQSDDWKVMNKAAVRQEYQNRLAGQLNPFTGSAAATQRSYLHVYPTGTVATLPASVTLPAGRPGAAPLGGGGGPNLPRNNWRIGINVEPGSMAAAVAALVGIMDNNAEINHIKFAAPGTAGKPDSVIIYMRKSDNTYAGIRAAVQNAVAGLNIQHKFSPMWDEISDGFAEAAEPPKGGSSFGGYRCNLAALAYLDLLASGVGVNINNYLAYTDITFSIFGIPAHSPHRQGPLNDPLYDDQMRRAFMQVLALKERQAANAYQTRQLINR